MTKSKNIKKSNGFHWSAVYIILYIIILSVIIVIFKIINIRTSYSPMFQWWNGNGGKQYDKFFNLFGIMASYDSKIIYTITNLFGSIFNSINRSQIIFLVDRIFPLIKSFDPNNRNYSRFVTPRHIASDIRFSLQDDDKWFTDFFKKGYDHPDGNHYLFDELIPLKYVDSGRKDSDNNIIYDREIINNKVGIYPSPLANKDWQYLFEEWGSGKWVGEAGRSNFLIPDKNNPVYKNGTVKLNWLDYEKHPDNFFSRYGIGPDSPLLVSFVNNGYSDPNQPGVFIDATALKTLINGHSPSTPGGWIGYLQGMESGITSANTYKNFIDSEYLAVDPSQGPDAANTSTCDTAAEVSNWTSALSQGAGIGGMAAFLPAAETIGSFLLGPAGIFLGLGVAIFLSSGITSQVNCNKENNKNKTKTTTSNKLNN